MSAQRAVGIRAGIREIVHAGIERGTARRLVVKTERVADLLTHYVEFLIGIVIGRGVEVSVIHLGGALRNMRTAGDIDRRQAEPAIVTIGAVAYLDSAGDHFAVPARSTSDRCEIHHGGVAPIRERSIELGGPVRS